MLLLVNCMKLYRTFIVVMVTAICCCWQTNAYSNSFMAVKFNTDTSIKSNTDTSVNTKPKHNHRLATKRSAIIPGWGQAYNKEYWKIPVVYGALAIPTITFFYNNTWYKRTKTAYDLLAKASDVNATPADVANYENNVDEKLRGFSLGSLQTFRNSFRKDRDYSVLWFVVVWGLNVVDATVFGHLKDFDVSDNLSMQINPSINPINNSKGFSLVFNLKKATPRIINTK